MKKTYVREIDWKAMESRLDVCYEKKDWTMMKKIFDWFDHHVVIERRMRDLVAEQRFVLMIPGEVAV